MTGGRAAVAAAVLSLVFAAALVLATGSALAQVPPVGATAEVRDVAGRLVAASELREGRGEVLITLIFATPPGLTGTHAVHVQEVGRCDPPDFLTAGADFNPTNKNHGRQNPDGPHVGDLPNVNFTNGLMTYNTSAPGATLGPGPASLLGPNRTALVIYSGEDDQLSDPNGNSGSRIACGVIMPAAPPGAAPAKPVVPAPLASPAVQPASAQPAPGQPAPVQAAPGQPAPGQPAPARPTLSPVPAQPVVPKPVTNPASAVGAASPVPIVAVPTSAPAVAAPANQTSGSLGTGPALIIAVLGVALIGAGFLLRRRSELR